MIWSEQNINALFENRQKYDKPLMVVNVSIIRVQAWLHQGPDPFKMQVDVAY